MTKEEFRKIIKEEVRPVKEMVEVVKQQIDRTYSTTHVNFDLAKSIKEQQSVMNEKLDILSKKQNHPKD